MEKPELLQLIFLAKEKNQKAQTKLINQFWTDVFSFVMKKMHDENVADELTVSVFSKVLAKLDLYDENFQFKTWVLTIAQNTVIDYWRKKNRETEETMDGFQDFKNQFEKSPEEIMISVQEEKKIIDAVAKMDHNYQKIIHLRFFEEKSIKEIAEELNLSVANTKVRIMRAKKVLAELLNENE
ncbi:sigma-70 family RNA polymerase sigma factor [Cloacibacterium normanense]